MGRLFVEAKDDGGCVAGQMLFTPGEKTLSWPPPDGSVKEKSDAVAGGNGLRGRVRGGLP